MAIESCKRCGSLYHKTIKDICAICVNQEEEDYKKVRMYLKRNKIVELKEVSRETNVEIELIYQFLQEGRISLGSGITNGYPCKKCDTFIYSGALCTNCTNSLNDIRKSLNSLSNAPSEEPVSDEKQKQAAFYARD